MVVAIYPSRCCTVTTREFWTHHSSLRVNESGIWLRPIRTFCPATGCLLVKWIPSGDTGTRTRTAGRRTPVAAKLTHFVLRPCSEAEAETVIHADKDVVWVFPKCPLHVFHISFPFSSGVIHSFQTAPSHARVVFLFQGELDVLFMTVLVTWLSSYGVLACGRR